MSSARGRLVFPAELPPLGWRTYRVRLGEVAGEPLAATGTRLENAHVLLELDPATGRIARLVHRASGADLAAPEARHAVVVDDRSDTWGHEVRAYDRELGEFECVSVRALECGPVRAILRVDSRLGSSTLREDYVLTAEATYVDVRIALDWHEQLKLLKLRYPTSVETDRATFETPSGPRPATRSRARRGSTSRAAAAASPSRTTRSTATTCAEAISASAPYGARCGPGTTRASSRRAATSSTWTRGGSRSSSGSSRTRATGARPAWYGARPS
jgi:hypothetical protein